MLFYLSSQSDWQLEFFRILFNGPTVSLDLMIGQHLVHKLLCFSAAWRRSHRKLSAVYMVRGSLTHLILVLLTSLIFLSRGYERTWAFSHSCFKTSNLLLSRRNRWEVFEFLHYYSNLHSHVSCYKNIPSKLSVLQKTCQDLIDKAIASNVIPMSALNNRLP